MNSQNNYDFLFKYIVVGDSSNYQLRQMSASPASSLDTSKAPLKVTMSQL
jgi:hypothetical protein